MAILSRVENATESLLARCFENYYSLQENAPSGLLDGGVAAAEQPAPALQPAVELCNILRDVLKPGDQQWLTDRFKVAANRRYHRLLDGADATISRGAHQWLLLCLGQPLNVCPNSHTLSHSTFVLMLCQYVNSCCAHIGRAACQEGTGLYRITSCLVHMPGCTRFLLTEIITGNAVAAKALQSHPAAFNDVEIKQVAYM